MKSPRRDPLRFDTLKALAHYADQQKRSVTDEGVHIDFIEEVRRQVAASIASETVLYGERNEALFETIVAALGKVKLLVQEDAGRAYLAGANDVVAPDYRMVLLDGSQLLVETKNFHHDTARQSYTMKPAYRDKLIRYAEAAGAELLFAVHWVRWNVWTLVAPQRFTERRGVLELPMESALVGNQMSRVGDYWIGTAPPLRMRIAVEEESRNGERRTVRIRTVDILSQDRLLVEPVQRRLATFLIFNGPWEEETKLYEEGGRATAIEFLHVPPDYNGCGDRECAIVAPVSSLITRWFQNRTSVGGAITSLQPQADADALSQVHLVPEDYPFASAALSLCVLRQKPPDERR
jgi:hypothetical protein